MYFSSLFIHLKIFIMSFYARKFITKLSKTNVLYFVSYSFLFKVVASELFYRRVCRGFPGGSDGK